MKRIIVSAEWNLSLNIVCPNCDNYFDYLQTKDYKQGGFENLRHCESDEDANIETVCESCGCEILIKETVY